MRFSFFILGKQKKSKSNSQTWPKHRLLKMKYGHQWMCDLEVHLMILLFINENKNELNKTVSELLNHHVNYRFHLNTLHQVNSSTIMNVTSVQPQYVYAK